MQILHVLEARLACAAYPLQAQHGAVSKPGDEEAQGICLDNPEHAATQDARALGLREGDDVVATPRRARIFVRQNPALAIGSMAYLRKASQLPLGHMVLDQSMSLSSALSCTPMRRSSGITL